MDGNVLAMTVLSADEYETDGPEIVTPAAVRSPRISLRTKGLPQNPTCAPTFNFSFIRSFSPLAQVSLLTSMVMTRRMVLAG